MDRPYALILPIPKLYKWIHDVLLVHHLFPNIKSKIRSRSSFSRPDFRLDDMIMVTHEHFLVRVSLLTLLCMMICLVQSAPLASASLSLVSDSGNSSVNAAPQIVCDNDLGGTYSLPNYAECEQAIAQIPRDPRGQPVERYFHVRPMDRSLTLPNVMTPIVKTVGRFAAKKNFVTQLLLT